MTERITVLVCTLSLLAAATIEAAVIVPPEIEILNATRSVTANAGADGLADFDSGETTLPGPFVDGANASISGSMGSNGMASSSLVSDITTFTIEGDGTTELSATTAQDGIGDASAGSSIVITFTVPVDKAFALSGKLDSSADPQTIARAEVLIGGMTTNDTPFFYQVFSQPRTGSEGEVLFSIDEIGEVEIKANTLVTLQVFASVLYTGQAPGSGQGSASFEMKFDLGDIDGDGLLDAWERDGIDIDGDDIPEVDLPSYGADPERKDIFVELDVMAGVSFDQSAIDKVKAAFNDAPADLVRNYDGSKGIKLHVILDGDRPEHTALTYSGPDLPSEFYTAKVSYFGSETDRIHPQSSLVQIARSRVFRYCLWADTIVDASNGGGIFGVAEGIPGNDFIVAAGLIVTSYPDIPSDKLSATFMHELGHTLNLGHGGQNHENRKPNYLSVMNYAYSVPFTKTTAQGTNVADYWRLDYSGKTMIDLDETSLDESQGLQGPQGRTVIFNNRLATDNPPVRRALWFASKPWVNWNNNGGVEKDPLQIDITRNSASATVEYDSTLESFTDWDRLWYHLAGTDDFDDRKPYPWAKPSPALDQSEIEEFYDVEWVDLTVLDDEVFSNGFELGSTTAWSDTVP